VRYVCGNAVVTWRDFPRAQAEYEGSAASEDIEPAEGLAYDRPKKS